MGRVVDHSNASSCWIRGTWSEIACFCSSNISGSTDINFVNEVAPEIKIWWRQIRRMSYWYRIAAVTHDSVSEVLMKQSSETLDIGRVTPYFWNQRSSLFATWWGHHKHSVSLGCLQEHIGDRIQSSVSNATRYGHCIYPALTTRFLFLGLPHGQYLCLKTGDAWRA